MERLHSNRRTSLSCSNHWREAGGHLWQLHTAKASSDGPSSAFLLGRKPCHIKTRLA